MTTRPRAAPPTDVKIQLRFLGAYSGITGRKQDEICIAEETTVGELLDTLADRYGDIFERRVRTDNGALRSDCKIFLDQDQVKLLDTPIRGDIVTLFFFTAVCGGCLTAVDASNHGTA